MRLAARLVFLSVTAMVLLPCGAAQADDTSPPPPTVEFHPQGVSAQSWTVPEGVEEITLYLDGGAGGTGDLGGGAGGRGGSMRGTFAVSPGDTLEILVGNNGPNGYTTGTGMCTIHWGGGESDGGGLFTWPGGAPAQSGTSGVVITSCTGQPTPEIGGGGAGGGSSEVILNHDGAQTVLLVSPGGGGGGGGPGGGTGGDAAGDGTAGGIAGGAAGKAPVGNNPGLNANGYPYIAATGPNGTAPGNGGQYLNGIGGGGGGGGWYGGGGGTNGGGGAGGSYYISPTATDPLVGGTHGQLATEGYAGIGYNTSTESPEPEADLLEPLPIIHGQPIVGHTLTCTQGEDTAPQFTISFQWLRDGKPISGATTDAYKVTSADANHKLQCQVTASDAAGSKTGVSKFVSVPPVVTLGSPRVKNSTASVRVTCKARIGKCTLSGVLTTVQKHKTITIGRGTLKLKRGKHGTLVVKLTHAGLKLRKHGHKLKATLRLLETTNTGTKIALQTKTVTFRA